MPNLNNISTDTTQLSQRYIRYAVSRVITNKLNNLLDMEVPAEFPEELLQNNVEINLYSLADNSLIFSDVIKNVSGSLFTETLKYPDGSLRNLLFIDFTKIPTLDIPVGQYSVTLNFFADELGSYDNRILKINKISTSRNEVELKLLDSAQKNKLTQVATSKIDAEYITPALRQIFNQPQADTLAVPMSPAKIDSSSLYENFISGSGEKILLYNFDDDYNDKVGVNTVAQRVLDAAYPVALKTVQNIILLGSSSFTEIELQKIVIGAMDSVYDNIIADQEINPQKYRFNLL